MSATTLDATAAGRFPLSGSRASWDQQIVARSWTLVTTTGIPGEVSSALDSWGAAIAIPAVATSAPPRSEVEAVEFIAEALGLPQVAVLKALRVPKRTFHGWKGKGHKPRQGAKDRVWAMTTAVAGLADVHTNLAAWFHATEEAQRAFNAGDVAALALADFTWARVNLQVQLPPVISFDEEHDLPNAAATASGNASMDLAAFLTGRPEAD